MSDRSDPDNSHSQSSSGTATASRMSSTAAAARSSSAQPHGKALVSEGRQYVITSRRPDSMFAAFPPAGLDQVEQSLKTTPEVEILDRIHERGGEGSPRIDGAISVLVARMNDQTAQILRGQGQGQLIVEPDQLLHLSHYDPEPAVVTGIAAAVGPVLSPTIVVLGKDNTPVREAEVCLFGALATASGLTDDRGHVTLSLSGETVQSVCSLYVKPKSDYWTFYLEQPALETSQPNLVFLRSLADTFPGFPRQQVFGWGQRAMRLDQLPAQFRGQARKVAIIDSGVATGHVDLQRIKAGKDLTNRGDGATTWNQDTVSHGSHCAGVIGAAENSLGIRGFAPEAEIHVCKLFPGGRISNLAEAIEYCIENQIDVANVSVGATERSEVIEQQVLRAKRQGVALIAAAGNSSGRVEFPASSPNVLAVAAIGKWGEFPPDSYHGRTLGMVDPNGFFSPRFTCFGPEVALCAPGVAILSAVPPNNYAVRDGTSLAAAHVTGLAALVLAHHPDFQGPFKVRNAARVDRLFAILRASAVPLQFGDPRRTGFGLPDVLIALGLAPPVSATLSMIAAPAPGSFSALYAPAQIAQFRMAPYQRTPVAAW